MGKKNRWSEAEIKALKKYYKLNTAEGLTLMEELSNRTIEAVRQKARALGLSRKYKPRGEKTIHSLNGYEMIYFPLCPYSWQDGRVYLHSLTWWLHKPLQPILRNETIHHVDGDKHNNDITNLVKMTRKEHTKLHKTNGENRW